MGMSLCLTPQVDELVRRLTGRHESLFSTEMTESHATIQERVTGKRILMVGAAGSIGSATLMALLPFKPAAITVMDVNENNLAELIRTVRSTEPSYTGQFTVTPLPYGSELARQYLETQSTFDLVLNFAALKHVRSERDTFSLLRMLSVNLLEADRFLRAVREQGHGQDGVFFVSTDKAADPVNLMGASKRIMESLLWAHAEEHAQASLLDGGQAPSLCRATTTRFANVAFSDGSLPWGFLQRLAKKQPLAGPRAIRRYFVSPSEAGQLCLLAAFRCPHHHILVPMMSAKRDAFSFADVARVTLESQGLEPHWVDNEDDARKRVASDLAQGRYPVLLTPGNTSGEKPMEHFVGVGETITEAGLHGLVAVKGEGVQPGEITHLLALIADATRDQSGPLPSFDDIVSAMALCVPELAHAHTGKSLDDRM
jgi:FlaA1/EpsC-like NDP-sugar epimerase